MKKSLVCLLAGLLAGFSFNAAAADAPDLKYGLYIHFGMDTFRHAGEKGQLPVERFAPTSLNVKTWAHAAKEAGMTFAVLTAKHESGFCLWDSQGYDYDIAHSPFKGDLIGRFHRRLQSRGHFARRALLHSRRPTTKALPDLTAPCLRLISTSSNNTSPN